jgi:hypothetical protein
VRVRSRVRRLLGMGLACVVLIVLASIRFVAGSTPAASAPVARASFPLIYTVADRYEPLAGLHGGERFPGTATVTVRDSTGSHSLVRGFAAAADPAVSFDAKSVLFAGREKAQDHWQVWEVALAGGAPRQITSCLDDCIRPFYLPGDRIVYAKKVGGHFALETAALVQGKAGAPVVRLTYGPEDALPSDVLRDGRILYAAMSPFGPEGTPELYTVYSDGSGVESYRCDHGKARVEGKQVISGDIVFATASGLGRFTSALAEEVSVAAPPGEYAGDIAETASGDWLLSWRRDDKGPFQLMLARVERAPSPAAVGSLLLVVNEPSANVVEPIVLAGRPAPKRHPSALHDWSYANLLCLNSYTSKYRFAEGSIHSMRLYGRDAAGNAKLMGTAPVERDGSFFVQVPADQPIQIELLDSAGKTLKREAGWFWMRRGEQRICVGCHAGPETAPENAVPMILLKSTTPADMTGSTTPRPSGGR